MKTSAVVAALLTACSVSWAGQAVVEFEQPDRYTDADWGAQAEAHRQVLAGQLQRLAESQLPAGQVLRVVFTDIDLAGERRPGARGLMDLRVLRGRADWPRLALRFNLDEGGRVLAGGSVELSDLNYLERRPLAYQNRPLPYEQRMLGEWFTRQFGADAH